MTARRWLFGAGIVAISLAACTPPPSSGPEAGGAPAATIGKTREELARDAFEAGGHQRQMVQLVREALGQMGSESRVGAIFDAEVKAAMPAVTEQAARIYAEEFTAQELADIVAFFRSAGGKAFLMKQAGIAERLQPIADEFGQSLLQRVVRRAQGAPPAAERGAAPPP